MNDGQIKFQVTVDSTSAEKNIKTLNQKATDLSKSFTNAGKSMTMGLTLPIVGLGVASVKFASDLEETLNKVDVSFGDSAKTVKDWSKTSIKAMGLAQQTALDSAALFGDMGTGMGIAEDSAADMAMSLTQLSADLASFKNVRQDVAETALKGVFTGETESLKGLGIVMTEANLEEFRMQKGIKKIIKDMTQAEKVQLRYAFVMDKTTKAQGDFERTSDGMANQTRMVGEQMKELSTQMGTILLPIALKLINGLSGLVTWFSSLDGSQKGMILTILGIVAAIGPLLMIIGNLITLVQGLSVAFGFLAANPIILLIGGIILVIVLLIRHFDEVMVLLGMIGSYWGKVFGNMWNITKDIFSKIGAFIGQVFKNVINGYISMINLFIKGINLLAKGLLTPFNIVIDGLNKISGVDIKKLSLNIKNVPYLATGTNNVQKEGLAYLHQGEAVVPKKYNPAFGGAGQPIVIEMGDVVMDGQKVGRIMTPYITRTVKVGGGNV